eukprot:TRINITY_DN4982_c0_g1_i1.p1 TRINITY_DN4982_c0_g1~~TRINITY_DN4982_c0_g1_i1.p1  ORF type:complete len:502 (+),score=136.03 TRINITY_DN4982_c0_g1_i1:209-1507(+)
MLCFANSATDWFQFSPIHGKLLQNDTKMLHFNNLLAHKDVIDYWNVFIQNAQHTMINFKNDTSTLLITMGVSFHILQDFYAHSNWAEIHITQMPDTNVYSRSTYFNANNRYSSLHTGIADEYVKAHPKSTAQHHGDYFYGLNKDSYVKEFRYERAFSHAFHASLEWMHIIRGWVGDENFKAAMNYRAHGDEIGHLQTAYDLIKLGSAYPHSPTDPNGDGHWKGYGSGWAVKEGEYMAELELAIKKGNYFNKFTKQGITEILSTDLYTHKRALRSLPIPPSLPSYKAVVVKTLSFKRIGHGLFGKRMSSMARITINGQSFLETTRHDRDAVSYNDGTKKPLRWASIKFIPATQKSVNIRYEFLNDNGSMDGEHIDIMTGGKKFIDITYDLTTGEISGDMFSADGVVSSSGNCNGCIAASIEFAVSSKEIVHQA